jgi:hypothetical protein
MGEAICVTTGGVALSTPVMVTVKRSTLTYRRIANRMARKIYPAVFITYGYDEFWAYANPRNSRPSLEPTNINAVPMSAMVECCGIDRNRRTWDTTRTTKPAQNIRT